MGFDSRAEEAFFVGEWRVLPSINQLQQGDQIQVVPPKLMAFLCALAEADGQLLRDDELMEAVWPDSVVSDSSLYQVVSQLRRVLGDNKKPREYIDRVSSKGYRLLLPPKRESQQTVAAFKASSSNSLVTPKYLIPILLTAVLAVWFGAQRWQSGLPLHLTPSVMNEHDPVLLGLAASSIGVLPLETLGSKSGSLEWIDGLSNAVFTQLATASGIRVVNVTPQQYSHLVGLSFSQIRRRLGVDLLVIGSAQQHDAKVHVSMQLIEDDPLQPLYATHHEGEKSALYLLQEQLSSDLMTSLSDERYLNHRPMPTLNEKLWHQYMLGKISLSQGGDQFKHALFLFEQVLHDAPDYTLASIGRCDASLGLYSRGQHDFGLLDKCCAPLLKVESNNPLIKGARDSSTGLWLINKGQGLQAMSYLERAMFYAPNEARAWLWAGVIKREQGQLKEALALHQRAVSLDPLSALGHRLLAFTLLGNGHYVKAKQAYQRALELDPYDKDRPADDLNFLTFNVERLSAFRAWSTSLPSRKKIVPAHLLMSHLVDLSLEHQIDAIAPLPFWAEASFFAQLVQGLITLHKEGNGEVSQGHFESMRQRFRSNPFAGVPLMYLMVGSGQIEKGQRVYGQTFSSYPKVPPIDVSEQALPHILYLMLFGHQSEHSSVARDALSQLLDREDFSFWQKAEIHVVLQQLEEAAVLIDLSLAQQWLPNPAELLFPFDDHPMVRQLKAAGFGQHWLGLLQKNRKSVLDSLRADDRV